jgi:trehalose utilization protein
LSAGLPENLLLAEVEKFWRKEGEFTGDRSDSVHDSCISRVDVGADGRGLLVVVGGHFESVFLKDVRKSVCVCVVVGWYLCLFV